MQAGDVGGNENIEHTGAPVDGEVDQGSPLTFPEEDTSLDGMLDHGRREEEKALLRQAATEQETDAKVAEARMEPDLYERAKAMVKLGAIDFPEEKPVNSGGMVVMQPLLSDVNLWAVFDALFGSELPDRPHFDTFRGRTITHTGEPLEGNTSVTELVKALSKAGIKGLKAPEVRRSYRDWILAKRMNDLEYRFTRMIPEWDGQSRLETLIIDIMEPFDDADGLNRRVGKYFWLSLYNRIMQPGCYAPIVLSLIGGQNAGKSNFSKLICREVIGPDANVALLDLAAIGNGTFLRSITGHSVIANIGEMVGLSKADLGKVKAFIPLEADMMDLKYEPHILQQRQWIIVMDGNSYDGFHRDETGNRRFYPMFCGQIDDEDGKPAWDKEFSAKFEEDGGFSLRFWQVMAECRAWMEEHGHQGYVEFTSGVVRDVQKFSEKEMSQARGVLHHSEVDNYFGAAMDWCLSNDKAWDKRKRGDSPAGAALKMEDICTAIRRLSRASRDPHPHAVRASMSRYGGRFMKNLNANRPGFAFDGISVADLKEKFRFDKDEADGEDRGDAAHLEYVNKQMADASRSEEHGF